MLPLRVSLPVLGPAVFSLFIDDWAGGTDCILNKLVHGTTPGRRGVVKTLESRAALQMEFDRLENCMINKDKVFHLGWNKLMQQCRLRRTWQSWRTRS